MSQESHGLVHLQKLCLLGTMMTKRVLLVSHHKGKSWLFFSFSFVLCFLFLNQNLTECRSLLFFHNSCQSFFLLRFFRLRRDHTGVVLYLAMSSIGTGVSCTSLDRSFCSDTVCLSCELPVFSRVFVSCLHSMTLIV